MFTRSLLVAVVILLFATPALPQFGQSNNNRLADLAGRLAREAGNSPTPTTTATQTLSAITGPRSKP